MYFKTNLNGIESWAKVFQSTNAFSYLSKAIFEKEHIEVEGNLEKLTPGSNAVFKIDNYVIKIYAPEEAGLHTEYDYENELAVMKYFKNLNISVPKIIAYGEWKDLYLFRYIIMDYIPNDISAENVIYSPFHKKEKFVKKIKEILENLNRPIDIIKPIDLKNQPIRIDRMRGLDSNLIDELAKYAQKLDIKDEVLVHGDITRDNIVISKDFCPRLIDFADCLLAPAYYELPALIFDLFLCDQELVRIFMKDEQTEEAEFLELLIKGLSLHLFCGNILKDYLTKIHKPFESIKSILDLKKLLYFELFLK